MIFEAIEFAAKYHAGQFRKGTKVPYIVHPLGVSKLLIDHGAPDEAAVAGVLHDTLEDTEATVEEIRERFGEKVAAIVIGATEPDRSESWENRKRHTVEYLGTAPVEILLVSLADKFDNLRSIGEALAAGENVWSRFKRGEESQSWYYRSLAGVFASRAAAGNGAVGSLNRLFQAEVDRIFPAR